MDTYDETRGYVILSMRRARPTFKVVSCRPVGRVYLSVEWGLLFLGYRYCFVFQYWLFMDIKYTVVLFGRIFVEIINKRISILRLNHCALSLTFRIIYVDYIYNLEAK